jgi:hypothetical protein
LHNTKHTVYKISYWSESSESADIPAAETDLQKPAQMASALFDKHLEAQLYMISAMQTKRSRTAQIGEKHQHHFGTFSYENAKIQKLDSSKSTASINRSGAIVPFPRFGIKPNPAHEPEGFWTSGWRRNERWVRLRRVDHCGAAVALLHLFKMEQNGTKTGWG